MVAEEAAIADMAPSRRIDYFYYFPTSLVRG